MNFLLSVHAVNPERANVVRRYAVMCKRIGVELEPVFLVVTAPGAPAQWALELSRNWPQAQQMSVLSL